jgi:hypothetical protein
VALHSQTQGFDALDRLSAKVWAEIEILLYAVNYKISEIKAPAFNRT